MFVVKCKGCGFVLRRTFRPSSRDGPSRVLLLYKGLPDKCPRCGRSLVFPPDLKDIKIRVVKVKKN